MATTISFKDKIDKPEWRPLANGPITDVAGASMCSDMRNDNSCHPLIYQFSGATTLNAYSPHSDEWMQLSTPGVGTIGAGSGCVFVPSAGPSGTITSGATTTSVVLSTALPAAVGVNQLANRGDGLRGFKIRLIGLSGGGSGKTSEAFISGNTSGTTPTITLATTLSFTPASGDRYEILSGRVFILGTSATVWKWYDVATNSYSGALTTTNLTTPSTDASFVVLDEQYVPTTQAPGGGFFGTLVATATAAGTLTGQTSSGDAGVAINEYRNFQIRIVQDTSTPTAVGQRRKITSHTVGASPVYTLASNWTVTPSATASYVIEGNNDILLWNQASTTTFSYAAGGFAADASWSTAGSSGGATQYANRGSAMGAGCSSVWAFGVTLDTAKNARYSFIYSFRGASGNSLDLLDIAGASTGSWSNAITYGNSSGQAAYNLTTGTCIAYDPVCNTGRYAYMNINASQRNVRFDVLNRVLEPYGYLRGYAQGAAVTGSRMVSMSFSDTAVLGIIYLWRSSAVEMWDIVIPN